MREAIILMREAIILMREAIILMREALILMSDPISPALAPACSPRRMAHWSSEPDLTAPLPPTM
jgi:hypothetical protein